VVTKIKQKTVNSSNTANSSILKQVDFVILVTNDTIERIEEVVTKTKQSATFEDNNNRSCAVPFLKK